MARSLGLYLVESANFYDISTVENMYPEAEEHYPTGYHSCLWDPEEEPSRKQSRRISAGAHTHNDCPP